MKQKIISALFFERYHAGIKFRICRVSSGNCNDNNSD